MRILFTFVGGSGHYEPLAPIARAARRSGHAVHFACRRSMVSVVEADGFEVVASGPDLEELAVVTALVPPDPANEDRVLRDGFAHRTAKRRASDLVALGRELRPEVLVCDEVDYGAAIAAELLGIPHAAVLVLVAGSFARTELLTAPLNDVRMHFGLQADPELTMLHRHLVLAPFPPSFRDPAFPLPHTAFAFRPATLEDDPALDPDRTKRSAHTSAWSSAEPHVYVTLGTIFTMESGDLFERILDALTGLPVEVIATVGRQRDPSPLEQRWPNVRVERFVAQADLLPDCDLVVCHGGSGSVIGALAHGVPLVVLPMGADQPHNAQRCEALGVGRSLDPVHADIAAIRNAVVTMLADPGALHRAEEFRAETLALPAVTAVVSMLERLAR